MRRQIIHALRSCAAQGPAVAFAAATLSAAACGRDLPHPGGLHTESQIAHVRAMISSHREPWHTAYRAFLVRAEAAMREPPSAVQNLTIAPYYQDPLAHREDSLAIARDARAAYTLALAYQLTGETRFADKAVELLDAWSVCTSLGNNEAALVVAYAGNGLVTAADLIFTAPCWRPEHRRRFLDGFVRGAFREASAIKQRPNNWGDWGTFASLLMHQLLDDEMEFEADVERLKRRIVESIDEQGRMPREIARGERGLWYTYFALSPMTASCQVVRNRTGEDLFGYRDARVKRACDRLLDWLVEPSGQLTWENWHDFQGRSLLELRGRNLLEAMADVSGDERYESWVSSGGGRPVEDTLGHHTAWVYPTLMRQTAPPPQ